MATYKKMESSKADKMKDKKMGIKEGSKKDKKADKTIKTTGTSEGKSNKLGGGGRFKQMVASGKSPALAAYIGRKKYGAKKMTSMAVAGKKAK